MQALGEKALEPRRRLRGGVGAGHADNIEAVPACLADERLLDGGGILKKSSF
jgi:hypothetical protein